MGLISFSSIIDLDTMIQAYIEELDVCCLLIFITDINKEKIVGIIRDCFLIVFSYCELIVQCDLQTKWLYFKVKYFVNYLISCQNVIETIIPTLTI